MATWKKCTIGELGQIITGKTPSTKNEAFWGGDVPFVTPKDIQQTKHIFKTERYITLNGLNAVRNIKLPPKAICVSCIGNIGYVGMTTQECISNQQINSIIVNDENDPDYVYYLIKGLWAYFKNYEGQSTTLSILNKTQFSQIEVSVPGVHAQRKIARVLSALDDKIEVNQKINDNLLKQAIAIFNERFINLPNIPNGWTKGCLLDIADYLNGLAMQKYRPAEGEKGLPVLKIKELRQGVCDENSEKCSENIAEDYIVHDGDVIFSWSGSLLVDLWCGGRCGLNQHLFKVTSDKYEKWFIYLWTAHYLKRFSAMAADKATTMGHIKRGDLASAEVLIPDKSSYQKCSSVLKPIIEAIIAKRLENRQLADLRNHLLPDLLEGNLSLSDI